MPGNYPKPAACIYERFVKTGHEAASSPVLSTKDSVNNIEGTTIIESSCCFLTSLIAYIGWTVIAITNPHRIGAKKAQEFEITKLKYDFNYSAGRTIDSPPC